MSNVKHACYKVRARFWAFMLFLIAISPLPSIGVHLGLGKSLTDTAHQKQAYKTPGLKQVLSYLASDAHAVS